MIKTYTLTGSQGEISTQVIDPSYNQIVVGVSYYLDKKLLTPATPASGTITIEGRVNGNRGWSELASSPIDCSDISAYASTSIPIQEIRVTSTGLSSGIIYQAVVTAKYA